MMLLVTQTFRNKGMYYATEFWNATEKQIYCRNKTYNSNLSRR